MKTSRLRLVRPLLAVLVLAVPGCATRAPRESAADAPRLSEKERKKQSDERVEAQARYTSGLIYELRHDPDKALEEFIQSVKADPSNEDLALDVSRSLLLKKDLPKALEIGELAVKQPNASAQAYANLAILYAEGGRDKDAEQANRKAIALAPDKLASYYNLYSLYLNQNQDDKARAVLDDARSQEVKSSDFWLDLAELYANFFRARPKQKDAVIGALKACLDRADTLGVTSPLRREKLADGYALAGDNEHAVSILLSLLDENQDNARIRDLARQRLLAIYISTDDADGALKQLEPMVREHPTNPQANFLLATVAFEKGDLERAEEYFRRTLRLNPDFEQAYYSLTRVLLELNKDGEAAALINTVCDKYPDKFVAHYLSALIGARREEHPKSVEQFTKAEIIARATSPERLDFFFYFQMGAEQERSGQYDDAAASFRRSIDLKGDFPESLNYLGYMWAEKGVHLDEARKLIQKAVDLDPNNAAFLDSLAWVLYKLDQPNLALNYMQQALKYQEEPDATLLDHLGDIQKAAGQAGQARKSWRLSVELAPSPEVQKKLDELPPSAESSAP